MLLKPCVPWSLHLPGFKGSILRFFLLSNNVFTSGPMGACFKPKRHTSPSPPSPQSWVHKLIVQWFPMISKVYDHVSSEQLLLGTHSPRWKTQRPSRAEALFTSRNFWGSRRVTWDRDHRDTKGMTCVPSMGWYMLIPTILSKRIRKNRLFHHLVIFNHI
jgi:hypothetical protein